MENTADFDALSRKANQSHGAAEDLDELSKAIFALEQWHFIARGQFPDFNPYIASNAEYADGRQMIRTFTDTMRLQRFAKENNLTEPDGSTMMLDIPTAGIVDYLERFIEYGVHGIWFNSDLESDGFFFPLANLRPIKARLEKLSAPAPAITESAAAAVTAEPPLSAPAAAEPPPSALATAIVVLKDGLGFASGFVKEATYLVNCFCRLPAAWTENGLVNETGRQKVFEKLYGKNWLAGNSDGSRYVVSWVNSKVFSQEDAQGIKWGGTTDTDENHYFFFIAGPDDELLSATEDQFAADIQRYAPPAENPLSPASAADSRFAGYLSWFRSGTVKYETGFKQIFRALAPFLENYAGRGEYAFTFATGSDEPEMRDLFEDVTSNAHGPYLKYRSYLFQRSAQETSYEMQMIGSNCLTEVQTGDQLRIQLTLHKHLDEGKTKLIVLLIGPGAVIEKISEAIRPALDDCDFAVQLESKSEPAPETLASLS